MTRKTVGLNDDAYNYLDPNNRQNDASQIIKLFKTKEKWLKKAYPHIDFVEIIDNNLVLRDKNLKNPYVEIKFGKDCHLWCSYCNENHCGHVYYSIARPEVALLEDNKKKK